MLIGYLFNIASERKLVKEIRVSLAYRLFLGYDLDETPPTHSVLSKAKRRFELDVFQAFLLRFYTVPNHFNLDYKSLFSQNILD